MIGELLPIWQETWREIWVPLSRHRDVPTDLWTSLFNVLVKPPAPPFPPVIPEEFDEDGHPSRAEDIEAQVDYEVALAKYVSGRTRYEEIVSGASHVLPAFRAALPSMAATESEARSALERAYEVIDGYEIEALRNRYFNLVDQFIRRFNLRYDLRRPFTFHPTPTGVYAKLFAEIVSRCQEDAALANLLRDYREAFQDLTLGATSGRINTCLQKQVNLLEGLTSLTPGVAAASLGKMCNDITTWPSTAVSEAAKGMYGFASDHTGLRHGTIKKAKEGRTSTVHRDMELRDLIAVSAFFTGMSAYLSDRIDPATVYGL